MAGDCEQHVSDEDKLYGAPAVGSNGRKKRKGERGIEHQQPLKRGARWVALWRRNGGGMGPARRPLVSHRRGGVQCSVLWRGVQQWRGWVAHGTYSHAAQGGNRGGDTRRQVAPSSLSAWRAGPVGVGGRWPAWASLLGLARRHSGIYDLFEIIQMSLQ
jgi:hypothetical protein